jgi:hypothetical protein
MVLSTSIFWSVATVFFLSVLLIERFVSEQKSGMEANQKWTTITILLPRPWLLVGSLLVGRNTEEAMILLLVESSPPRCFALLVGSRLVDVSR